MGTKNEREADKSNIYVIDFSHVKWSLAVFIFGCFFSSHWSVELVHLMRGYRWDSSRSCIMDSIFPYTTKNLCRAAEDCSACSEITSINGVDGDNFEKLETFNQLYQNSSRPYVVRGAASQTKIVDIGDFNWIKSIYHSEPSILKNESKASHCFVNNYKYQEFRNKAAILRLEEEKMYLRESRPGWIVSWKICEPTVLKLMEPFLERPAFIKEQNTDPISLAIGTVGGDAIMEREGDENYYWDIQVKGEREVTFTPPPECYYSCKGPLKTTLYPGDVMLYNTDFWKHSVLVVGDQVSISYKQHYT